MKSIKKAIKQVKCLRCGYKWFPKHPGIKPKYCADCHSPYWATPIKRKGVSNASKRRKNVYIRFQRANTPTMQELVLKSIRSGKHARKEIQKDLKVPIWNIDGAITKLRRNRIITINKIGHYYER